MTPETLIKAAIEDGVQLILTSSDTLTISGKRSAVQRWRPEILEHKADILATLEKRAGVAAEANGVNSEIPHCWWQLHYSDRAPMHVAYCPPARLSEVLSGEPDAIAAEPYEPTKRRPDKPLSVTSETLLRQWLAMIGETDADTINDLLHTCQVDADAREYFIRLAGEKR